MASKNVTIVGLQWGDEGKGKVVDALARVCRYVVRFCGGANAGHSVHIGAEKFAMHLIPCGVFNPGVINVIGNGVVFDPAVAVSEIDGLVKRGVAVDARNLRISSAAHVVMPWHKLQDSLNEAMLGGGKIGTTARGIGPCYADKASRSTAIRVGELTDEAALREKIAGIVAIKNKIFAALYNAAPMDAVAIADEFVGYGKRLAGMICNTGAMLRSAIDAGERILFEGGQGAMLDVDHGTYPFVTSSSVSACGVPSGTGVPPSQVGQVLGIIKAYTSRVGAGPFPTEQDNAVGNRLRERGHEYGTTTGRPRRCGWLDAVALRYAADLSGADEFALSLLDVLSGLDEIKICTSYRIGGKTVEALDPCRLGEVECVYETLKGWKAEIGQCRRFEDLPAEAQGYIRRVEELLGRPVGFVSVGADRLATITHRTSIEGLA
ncbi:MAG: adenylosuccinate synthase [Phycisphaerae bacterium]|jgi:adenylosuccinate synthase